MKLIVTGQSTDNKGVVIVNQQVPESPMVEDGAPGVLLWQTKPPFTVPFDKALKNYSIKPATYVEGEDGIPMPGPGDVSFYYGYIGPNQKTPIHATESIDQLVVLKGELWLIMEDGEEVHLSVGDCVVQLGVPHIWENRSDQGTFTVITSLGASWKKGQR